MPEESSNLNFEHGVAPDTNNVLNALAPTLKEPPKEAPAHFPEPAVVSQIYAALLTKQA